MNTELIAGPYEMVKEGNKVTLSLTNDMSVQREKYDLFEKNWLLTSQSQSEKAESLETAILTLEMELTDLRDDLYEE
jgi:hypothetical protein